MTVEGIQFVHQGDKTKNLEFYLGLLRSFLAKNLGDVVWVKGGVVEREAFLLYNSGSRDVVKSFWTREMDRTNTFAIRAMTAVEVNDQLTKIQERKRVYIGRLDPVLPLSDMGWTYDPEYDHRPISCPACGGPVENIYDAIEKGCLRCGYQSQNAPKDVLQVVKPLTEL